MCKHPIGKQIGSAGYDQYGPGTGIEGVGVVRPRMGQSTGLDSRGQWYSLRRLEAATLQRLSCVVSDREPDSLTGRDLERSRSHPRLALGSNEIVLLG